jgi:hypothetical protein
MVMVALLTGQTVVLEVVQVTVFTPWDKPVTVALGWVPLINTPVAGFTVQSPLVEPVGVLAAKARVGVLKQMVCESGAVVMTAGLGGGCTTRVMLALVVGQTAVLEVVHTITLVPSARALTVVVGFTEKLKLPPPGASMVHWPVVPPVGVLAASARVGVLKHKVCESGAVVITAGLGGGCTRMVMVALLTGQTVVLDVVQVIVFTPSDKPVTVALGWVPLMNTPVTGLTVQSPLVEPVGVLAAKARVGVLKQIVCESGAVVITAGLGGGCTTMVMLALVVGQAAVLEVVHTTTLVPSARALTVVVGLTEKLKLPLPGARIVHSPVVLPVGVLAARPRVGVLKHKVCESGAVVITAGLGGGCTTRVMLALVVGQTAVLEVVHTMTFVPSVKALTVVVGFTEKLKLPLPGARIDH